MRTVHPGAEAQRPEQVPASGTNRHKMAIGIVQLRNVKRKFKNSLGTGAQCVFQTHGRKFQLSSLQMKFSSLVRAP